MATSRREATPKAGASTAAATAAAATTGQAAHGAPASVQGQGLGSAPMPTPAHPRAGEAQIPRPTLDNPWRDLHPARVWPD